VFRNSQNKLSYYENVGTNAIIYNKRSVVEQNVRQENELGVNLCFVQKLYKFLMKKPSSIILYTL